MASEHVQLRLQAGSEYIGRTCPTTRRVLGSGDNVVVCLQQATAYSLEAWDKEILPLGTCPSCGVAVSHLGRQQMPSTASSVSSQPIKQPVDARPGTARTRRRLLPGLAAILVIGAAAILLISLSQRRSVAPAVPAAVLATSNSGTISSGTSVSLAPIETPTVIATAAIQEWTPTSSSQQAIGKVTEGKLNVRNGPGTAYPILTQLDSGDTVAVIGRNQDWWQVELSNGFVGWVSRKYIALSGTEQDIAFVSPPNTPVPTSTPKRPTPQSIDTPVNPTRKPSSTPEPSAPELTNTPKPPQQIAANRYDFTGSQGSNGWKYLMESDRNSGQWREMVYDGSCFRTDNWEKDARICADGEVHPGQSTRVAYEWRPGFSGSISLTVHAHKIDSRCGDGVWVGTYRARDGVGMEAQLGGFKIGGGDNVGRTETYQSTADPGNLFYIIIDINGDSTCDQSRLFVDIK